MNARDEARERIRVAWTAPDKEPACSCGFVSSCAEHAYTRPAPMSAPGPADAYECATQRCDPNQCRHEGSAVELPLAIVRGGSVPALRLLGTWLACRAEQLLAVMVLTTACVLVAIAWTWWT